MIGFDVRGSDVTSEITMSGIVTVPITNSYKGVMRINDSLNNNERGLAYEGALKSGSSSVQIGTEFAARNSIGAYEYGASIGVNYDRASRWGGNISINATYSPTPNQTWEIRGSYSYSQQGGVTYGASLGYKRNF